MVTLPLTEFAFTMVLTASVLAHRYYSKRIQNQQSWQTIMTRQITLTRQILGKLFNGNRTVEGPGTYHEFKGWPRLAGF